MTYAEKVEETQKPIYKKSAKLLWDKTYSIFKNDLYLANIYDISHEVLWCIEMESRYNCILSIYDIINIKSYNEKISFLNKYLEELKIKSNFYEPRIIKGNLNKLCEETKLNELILYFKEISYIIGNDLMFLICGAYFNECEYDYLGNYHSLRTHKKIVKEVNRTQTIWKIKANISELWEEEDIVLEDMAFVWPSFRGYSRFLDNSGRWGFIDIVANERYYMPDNIYSIRDLRWGRAVFLDKNNGLYGYVDCKGKVVIEPKFINAMDFMYLMGKLIAVVQYAHHEVMKITTDAERTDITGDARSMGITIFRDLITIDSDGNFTPEIQKKYDDEKKRYYDKVNKEERKLDSYKISNYSYGEDEDDIMNALEGGYGDIYGF